MRRSRRLAAASFCALTAAIALATTSLAATVGHQAWVADSIVPTFAPQEGRIYVAATAGGPDARAFVEIDEPSDAVALRLVEDEGSLFSDSATLAACALAEELPASGELDEAPAVDCRFRGPIERGPEGVWSVGLAIFADAFADGARGIAIIPDLSTGTETFRVAFRASGTTVEVVAPATRPSTTAVAAEPDRQPLIASPVPAPPAPPAAPDTIDSAETEGPAAAIAPSGSPSTPRPTSDTSTPGLTAVVVALALVGLLVLAQHARRFPGSLRELHPARWGGTAERGWRTLGATVVAVAVVAPMLADERTIFRAGIVIISMIAAFGLHILVNWVGELSLAHAAFVGLPAFTAAKLSADHGISPIVLLPVAVVVGAALGGVVGLPALRARGLQVALVTLAAGVAVERFFFTKPWLIGAGGGVNVATPTLGPFRLTTTRSLYAVLIVALAISVLVGAAIYRSKLGRALLWIRSEPDAAAVFGVRVAVYKVLAYGLAGGFAGFAGGLSGVWVQRLTAQAFPFTLSFTFLVIVVIAGRGFLGGVIAAAAILEGGRVFSSGAATIIIYGGPIALILVLTRYKAGLNGIGREVMGFIDRMSDDDAVPAQRSVSPSFAAGVATVVLGFAAITLAWYHAGNTDQLWIQNQEILSGGVGGLALVVLGVGLLIRDRIARSQAELADRLRETILEVVAGAQEDSELPRRRKAVSLR